MTADPAYAAVADRVGGLLPCPGRPLLVGIAGPVSVGKSTTATILAALLGDRGVRVEVLGTDCFLYPNDVLALNGTTGRKGFPETFDHDAISACLGRLRGGDGPVDVPVYSHAVYDVVPGETRRVGGADVVVVEGVNALQQPVLGFLDLPVYVDADDDHVRDWFVARFLELCAAAESAEGSFYRIFAVMTPEERAAIALSAWDGINLPNLVAHIRPSRAAAALVVRKAADHSVLDVSPPA